MVKRAIAAALTMGLALLFTTEKIYAQIPEQPQLSLPFAAGEQWTFQGTHVGSDPHIRSSLDFYPVPKKERPNPCEVFQEWVLAPAEGVITKAGDAEVYLDLDGDNNPTTGWGIQFLHIGREGMVALGPLKKGDRIGHPSCEVPAAGNITADGAHLHIERRFNGMPVAVEDESAPFVMSGYSFRGCGKDYEGFVEHPQYGRIYALSGCNDYNPYKDEENRTGRKTFPVLVSDNTVIGDIFTIPNLPVQVPLEVTTERIQLVLGAVEEIASTFITSTVYITSTPLTTMTEGVDLPGFERGRLLSTDKAFIAPAKSKTMCSDEKEHTDRGAEMAWDLCATYGALVFPMAPGKVTYAGCDNKGRRGCRVEIDHEGPYKSMYGHLIDESHQQDNTSAATSKDSNVPRSDGTVMVKTGDIVNQWTPIGRVGFTGYTSFGPHIHWIIMTDGAMAGNTRIDKFFDKSLLFHAPPNNRVPQPWPWDRPYVKGETFAETYPISKVKIPVGKIINFDLFMYAFLLFLIVNFKPHWFGKPVVWTLWLLRRGQADWQWPSKLIWLRLPLYEFGKAGLRLSIGIPCLLIMMWVWLGGLGDWNVNFRVPDALAHVSVPGESNVKWLPHTVSKWWPEIAEASRVHDVDPDFISFVMLQESCGYSKATSRSGAKGLIQVMPATAKDIAAKRGLSLALADQMYDPKVNLDFGAYYLGQQYRRYRVPGNEQLSIELAAAAYNGGPGSVDCYLKGGTYRYGPGMCDTSQGPGFSAETTKYRQLIGTWWRDRAAATSSNIPNNSLCKQAQGE